MRAGTSQASTLRHIAGSVGAESRSLWGMFTAYYDAAGGKDHGFIVVAGWVSDLEMWEKFAVDWRLALAQAHVPYFHMKAFSQSKLHFESWKDQEGKRRNFLHTLTSIIRSYVRYGVGT